MLITNHVLSGAVAGDLAGGVVSAAAVGLASHAVLDAVPHFGVDDRHLMKVAVPDGLLGLAAIGVVLAATPSGRRLRVAAGIVGACLPDLDKPGRQFLGRSPYPAGFDAAHKRIQRESPWLLPLEVAVAAGLAALLAASGRTR